MCGIAGHVALPGNNPLVNAVTHATQALAHRGPNGEGILVAGDACFGHRRLSVIDIMGSAQPWVFGNGRWMLIFNGEIYNYLELRKELIGRGHTFRSQGDTEVLLTAYVEWGADCLSRLNGMFAFAIWDRESSELFIARDRLGKKPLYYAELPANAGGGIAFASELGALTVFPDIANHIDSQALADYLAYQCVPFERTIHPDARKLAPAHYLVWRAGHFQITRWWAPPRARSEEPSVDAACETLRALVDDATRLRLRADVPLGAFLSGGIDSAVVVSALTRHRSDLLTYTIGFDDATFDERAAARASSEYFGTHHHDQCFRLDVGATLDRLTSRFGEPFADISALPAWHLFGAARQSVTVALSGDGGDELFGGYRRYFAGRWVAGYLRWPTPLRGLLEAVILRLPEPQTYFGRSRLKQLRLFLEFARRQKFSGHDCLPQTFSFPERLALLQPDILAQENDVVNRYGLDGLGFVEQMMLADLQAYLAEDVLTKVDRTSMDHALEVRSPLLDHRVVEFACSIPTTMKLRGRTQKWLLRKAFADRLPPHVLRGNKQGFSVPIGALFRNVLATPFEEEVLSDALDAYFRREELSRLWKEHRSGRRDHGQKLWTLFAFARWHRAWASRKQHNEVLSKEHV